MWQVENLTPFAAHQAWTRDRDGGEVWMVAVRAAFHIRSDGSTTVAEDQDPVVLAPKYSGGPNGAGLLYDTDFYLTKPTSDVLLHGHAYAPGGRPATQMDVTIRVGEIRKTLRVTGDRVYEKGVLGVEPGAARSFTRMPIVYERAYGGRKPAPATNPDWPEFEGRNPIGTGFAPTPGQPVPNIEYPGGDQENQPAGFGPIPPHWSQRVKYAGTYDEAWRKERLPLYPKDLDDRFFLCSPEDQRPSEFLRGGEPVELLNLTPEGRMAFALPRIALGFETVFRGGERVSHRGRLHTVILEPDVPRVILVWRTALPCHSRGLKLQETTVVQKRVINSRQGQKGADRETNEED